jgi:hypothetical protein
MSMNNLYLYSTFGLLPGPDPSTWKPDEREVLLCIPLHLHYYYGCRTKSFNPAWDSCFQDSGIGEIKHGSPQAQRKNDAIEEALFPRRA